MKLAVSVICLTFFLVTEAYRPHPLSDEFISQLNRKARTWTARKNFPTGTSVSDLKKRLGVLPSLLGSLDHQTLRIRHDIPEDFVFPKEFDSRVKWSYCTSLAEIRDQGSCGSCWAISSAEVMTDRYCIHSNGKKRFHFSVEELVSCCDYCGYGCQGGWPSKAFKYWADSGVVSGGPFNSSLGCYPYEVPSVNYEVETPECKNECQSDYPKPFRSDKQFGKKVYSVEADEETIKYELITNGPVVGAFDVYEDFMDYSSGVYQHEMGYHLGGHAIKIIGYGVEEGTPYWLCSNSWNYSWGDQGYFKILRGSNECGIEGEIVTGLPHYKHEISS